jgi:tRNA uracil 4-sulfurtransferase
MEKKKLICLLSGGIDSPVAAYKMMDKGYEVVLVHFHNITPSSHSVKDKIDQLAQKLTKYQKKVKLYIVPFGDLQRELVKSIPAKQRMIIYRRFMFRIGCCISKKEKALGFVTGDSLAQVASQTLDNLNVIYSAIGAPVFHPLIGWDKQDIIEVAKQIDTYDISVLPYDDCCSFLIADRPETHANIDNIEAIEKQLDVKALVKKTAKGAKHQMFK